MIDIARETLRLSASRVFTERITTHASILTSQRSTTSYDAASSRWKRSPTPSESEGSIFGRLFSSDHLRRRPPIPVSCYALFKR